MVSWTPDSRSSHSRGFRTAGLRGSRVRNGETASTNTAPVKATELFRLHADPALLTVVNVWDSVSARGVAGVAGTTALATASHSIAASYGYPEGEKIPQPDHRGRRCRRRRRCRAGRRDRRPRPQHPDGRLRPRQAGRAADRHAGRRLRAAAPDGDRRAGVRPPGPAAGARCRPVLLRTLVTAGRPDRLGGPGARGPRRRRTARGHPTAQLRARHTGLRARRASGRCGGGRA